MSTSLQLNVGMSGDQRATGKGPGTWERRPATAIILLDLLTRAWGAVEEHVALRAAQAGEEMRQADGQQDRLAQLLQGMHRSRAVGC